MLVTRSNLTRTRVHRMRQARIQERIRPHSRARTHTRTTYNTGEPADLNFDPEVVRLLNVLLNDDGDEDRIPEHQQMKLDALIDGGWHPNQRTVIEALSMSLPGDAQLPVDKASDDDLCVDDNSEDDDDKYRAEQALDLPQTQAATQALTQQQTQQLTQQQQVQAQPPMQAATQTQEQTPESIIPETLSGEDEDARGTLHGVRAAEQKSAGRIAVEASGKMTESMVGDKQKVCGENLHEDVEMPFTQQFTQDEDDFEEEEDTGTQKEDESSQSAAPTGKKSVSLIHSNRGKGRGARVSTHDTAATEVVAPTDGQAKESDMVVMDVPLDGHRTNRVMELRPGEVRSVVMKRALRFQDEADEINGSCTSLEQHERRDTNGIEPSIGQSGSGPIRRKEPMQPNLKITDSARAVLATQESVNRVGLRVVKSAGAAEVASVATEMATTDMAASPAPAIASTAQSEEDMRLDTGNDTKQREEIRLSKAERKRRSLERLLQWEAQKLDLWITEASRSGPDGGRDSRPSSPSKRVREEYHEDEDVDTIAMKKAMRKRQSLERLVAAQRAITEKDGLSVA